MKFIEIELSEEFRKYAMKNIDKRLQTIKVVRELMKDKNIHKPEEIKLRDTSVSDLKYKTSKIKELKINIAKGIFIIGY